MEDLEILAEVVAFPGLHARIAAVPCENQAPVFVVVLVEVLAVRTALGLRCYAQEPEFP